jgi:hypothetical protein
MWLRLEAVEFTKDAEPEQGRRYGEEESDDDQPAVIQCVR